MGLCFKRERDGRLRPWWYGDYTRKDGRRTVVNLQIKVEGKPPEGGRLTGTGDAAFEKSRARALAALELAKEEATRGRMERSAALRVFMEKTGAPLDMAPIEALRNAFDSDKRRFGQGWLKIRKNALEKFIDWAREQKITSVLDVTLARAREYWDFLYENGKGRYTAKTARIIRGVAASAMDRVLPEGAMNPFRHPTLRLQRARGDVEVNRAPLNEEELGRLLVAAKETDPQVYDWMVCAVSTGLRRGDVSRLRWADVDLAAGMLLVRTSKTGVEVQLPILPLLAEVLARRKAGIISNDAAFVFPEAEAMARENSAGMSYRVKKVFANAFGSENATGNMNKRIASVTRVKREVGQNSASRYDFHCLRTTFVTLAISAGFSADKLRALTGHTTVTMVLRHYYKPKGADLAEELKRVMPGLLTKPTA